MESSQVQESQVQESLPPLKRHDLDSETVEDYESIVKHGTLNVFTTSTHIKANKIYAKGISNFYNMIPKDYEYRKEILYWCYELKDKLEGVTATEVVLDGKLFKEADRKDIYLYKDEFYGCSFNQLTILCFKLKDEGVYLE